MNITGFSHTSWLINRTDQNGSLYMQAEFHRLLDTLFVSCRGGVILLISLGRGRWTLLEGRAKCLHRYGGGSTSEALDEDLLSPSLRETQIEEEEEEAEEDEY